MAVPTQLIVGTARGYYPLQMEDTRGSIETGKYADFIFVNKDISSCAKDKIHEGEVKAVYFEGREVYTA